MAEYVSIEGVNLSDYVTLVRPVVTADTGAKQRRAAALTTAERKLREWVCGDNEHRPTRDDLRVWAGILLSERRELREGLERVTHERDLLHGELASQGDTIDAVEAERDELRAQLDAAVREREIARRQSARLAVERDEARALHGTEACDCSRITELHDMLEAADADFRRQNTEHQARLDQVRHERDAALVKLDAVRATVCDGPDPVDRFAAQVLGLSTLDEVRNGRGGA